VIRHETETSNCLDSSKVVRVIQGGRFIDQGVRVIDLFSPLKCIVQIIGRQFFLK